MTIPLVVYWFPQVSPACRSNLATHFMIRLTWDLIANLLMWSGLIEEVFVFIKHALESVQAQNDQMVQALLAKTSNPTLGKGIGVGSLIRSFDELNSEDCWLE